MARQRRITEPGAYHHITARGVDRCEVFLDDHDRRGFLKLLAESKRRFGCSVLAYCLMDNHVHLTLRDDEGTLSKTLHLLNGVYAKRFNLRHERTGHLFERRFWNSMLDSEAYLTTCVAYVHMNPVAAHIVEHPEEYPWSSYASYVGLRRPPNFLDTTTVMAHYGHDLDRFRRQTEQPDLSSITEQLRLLNPPTILGDGGTQSAKLAPGVEAEPSGRVRIDEVITACAAAAGVSESTIRSKAQGRRCPARQLASFVAHRHANIALRTIADELDHSSAGAVSVSNARFEQKLEDPELRSLLDKALAALRRGDASTC